MLTYARLNMQNRQLLVTKNRLFSLSESESDLTKREQASLGADLPRMRLPRSQLPTLCLPRSLGLMLGLCQDLL